MPGLVNERGCATLPASPLPLCFLQGAKEQDGKTVIRWHRAYGRDYLFYLHAGQLALGDNQPRKEERGRGGGLTDSGLHVTPVRKDLQLTGEGVLCEGVAEAGNIWGAITDQQNVGACLVGNCRSVGGPVLGLALAPGVVVVESVCFAFHELPGGSHGSVGPRNQLPRSSHGGLGFGDVPPGGAVASLGCTGSAFRGRVALMGVLPAQRAQAL